MPEEKFELVFFDGTNIRYRRHHSTFEAAEAEARRVLAKMDDRNAHPAVIYGPGFGIIGMSVR